MGRAKQWWAMVALGAVLAGCIPDEGELEAGDVEEAVAEHETGEASQYALGEALNTTPAGWWWYYGQTPAQVSAIVDSTGGRIVSLQVESTSPLLFSVALVSNTGSNAKGWWWYYGQTAAQLGNLVSSLNARIVNLHPYVVNGTTYFAAVLLPNTGADAAGWWWYYGVSSAQIATLLNDNNARLIDLNRYTINGSTVFSAVMIHNAGSWGRAWWYYYNVSGSTVGSLLQQSSAMLTNIEPAASDGSTFDVVMEQPPSTPHWWWYYGQTPGQLGDLVGQNGARLIDLKTYVAGGSRRFAAIMVNNSNAATTRVGNILRSGTDGVKGLYLKRIGGSVQASLLESKSFEPASSLKILIGLHAMRNGSLATTVPIYAAAANSSCPTNLPIGTESMGNAINLMLTNSDNQRTRVLSDWFGFNAINQTATTIGLSSGTHLNHIIGCGGPIANTLTLSDAGRIYEGIANASLLTTTQRDALYARMPAQTLDFTGIESATNTIVNQEAPAFGLTAGDISTFKTALRTHYKAGGYGVNGLTYLSVAGSVEIPACSGATQVRRDYVWGIFIHGASNETNANNTFGAAKAEPLREPIRSALATWAACAP